MLQRDYILELVSEFVRTVKEALRLAEEDGSPEACQEVEAAVAELLELDPDVALALSPDSLVTLMILSGIGAELSGYVAFALDRLARVYEARGERELAALRRAQAEAVAESFDWNLASVPPGLEQAGDQMGETPSSAMPASGWGA